MQARGLDRFPFLDAYYLEILAFVQTVAKSRLCD
jgi:hypothetical protein